MVITWNYKRELPQNKGACVLVLCYLSWVIISHWVLRTEEVNSKFHDTTFILRWITKENQINAISINNRKVCNESFGARTIIGKKNNINSVGNNLENGNSRMW